MSEPEVDMFGQVVAAAAAPVPVAPISVGKTKLVFGQPAPAALPPPRVAPISGPRGLPTLAAMPPALTLPRYVRPAEEHAIDEAQAASLLFTALARLAERRLYELRVGRHDYMPVIPGADDLRIAAELLMADPAVALRLGLLAGTFREPPPLRLPAAATPASVLAAQPQKPQADGAGAGAELGTEAAPAPQEPAQPVVPQEPPRRRRVAPPPVSTDLPDQIAMVIIRINKQLWEAAQSLVQALPEGIRPHWQDVLARAQEARRRLADGKLADLDAAEVIAVGMDCQPVRDTLEADIGVAREAIPAEQVAPAKPARRARGGPGAA